MLRQLLAYSWQQTCMLDFARVGKWSSYDK